jgi:hypothetical protein
MGGTSLSEAKGVGWTGMNQNSRPWQLLLSLVRA